MYEGRAAPHQSERSERAADVPSVPAAPRVAAALPQVWKHGPLPPCFGADGRMVGWSAYAAGVVLAGPRAEDLQVVMGFREVWVRLGLIVQR